MWVLVRPRAGVPARSASTSRIAGFWVARATLGAHAAITVKKLV
jgi:hypothetical protein